MPLGFAPLEASGISFGYTPLDFGAVPGWTEDDHAAAYAAFQRSCGPVLRNADALRQSGKPLPPEALTDTMMTGAGSPG